jgi:Holliday junction DNA helicase RuvA
LIASLKGTVLSKKPERIIIDVGGVGYSVAVPLCSIGDIPDEGSSVFMYIYTHVREDALQLYGFLSEDERKVFATLMGISGIGPKIALAILSGMPVKRFMEAVYGEDIAMLATIPGLGNKTAARLVLELKGRLQSLSVGGQGPSSKMAGITADALSALVNLGYRKSLSEKAVDHAVKNGANTIEGIIKDALKALTESS